MTYNVFGGTLSLTQSINHSSAFSNMPISLLWSPTHDQTIVVVFSWLQLPT